MSHRRWFCLSVLLLSLLGLSASFVSAQGQLINGNRTIAGSFNYGIATGSGTAYVLTLNPSINPSGTGSYIDGTCFTFRAPAATTGSATLNVNGMGARTLRKRVLGVATDLGANDIGSGQDVTAC